MPATTMKIIALLCVLVQLFNLRAQSFAQNHIEDAYYWRVYKGRVSKDAFRGGVGVKGNPTYIGQVLHGNMLIPAKIDLLGDNQVTYEWGYKEYVAHKNIKILCTQHPEKFSWVGSGNGLIQNLDYNRLVEGGFELNANIWIGRIQLTDELAVGKIISGSRQTTLNTSRNGTGYQHGSFEVLTYNPHVDFSIDTRGGDMPSPPNNSGVKCRKQIINFYI